MAPDSSPDRGPGGQSSTLPFDPADLVKMRVTPARLAAMCGITRQAVSKWIKNGWVTLGPDGLLDPAVATRQYLRHVDPARAKARILKSATVTHAEMRARIQSLEAAVADAVPSEELAKRLDAMINAALAAIDFGAMGKSAAAELLTDLAITYVMEPGRNDSRGTDEEVSDEQDDQRPPAPSA